MKTCFAILICLAIPVLTTRSAVAQVQQDQQSKQDKKQSKQDEQLPLGFDTSKIPPPDPVKGEPVARVLDNYVYQADLWPRGWKIDAEEETPIVIVQSLVLSKLRARYAETHEIKATKEEVRDFNNFWTRQLDLVGLTIDHIAFTAEERQQRAERAVIGWKVNRELYKKYGGPVIFQQANPMEPVGAYRKFLEEMQEAKLFEVFDEQDRARFWEYFTRNHTGWEVAPEDINFDVPWWMQADDDGL